MLKYETSDETGDSKFVTRKWNIASNQLSANYDMNISITQNY